jgi:fatty-acid desaturase
MKIGEINDMKNKIKKLEIEIKKLKKDIEQLWNIQNIRGVDVWTNFLIPFFIGFAFGIGLNIVWLIK